MNRHDVTDPRTAAWVKYQRMRVRLTGRLSRELAQRSGLSEADFEILCALTESPNESVRAARSDAAAC